MGFKTISLSEKAYRRLAERKREGESFSDVVLRITGNSTLRDFVGILSTSSCDRLEENLALFHETRCKTFKEKLDVYKD